MHGPDLLYLFVTLGFGVSRWSRVHIAAQRRSSSRVAARAADRSGNEELWRLPMDSIVDKIDRRRFFGTAAMALAATQLGMIRSCGSATGGDKNSCRQARSKHVLRTAEAG